MREHPENDLNSASDRFSRVRPEPKDFDALADEPDPLVTAQRNRDSTRQAIWYAIATVAITLLIGAELSDDFSPPRRPTVQHRRRHLAVHAAVADVVGNYHVDPAGGHDDRLRCDHGAQTQPL